jgi:hypothetical protein
MAGQLLPLLLFSLVCAAKGGPSVESHLLQQLGAQAVNLWRLDQQEAKVQSSILLLEKDSAASIAEFEPQWFEQPLDHFDESNPHTFNQRYWVNKRHYQARAGAPVIVLDGGETSGEVCHGFLRDS